MTTEILLHTIKFWWDEGEKLELDACDVEHIKEQIEKGFSSGELCQSTYDKNDNFIKDVYGWWEIKK